MSIGKSRANSGAMLDLWRPPPNAGEPIGCLATTYTFAPGLFDEQCLARFLEMGVRSRPGRFGVSAGAGLPTWKRIRGSTGRPHSSRSGALPALGRPASTDSRGEAARKAQRSRMEQPHPNHCGLRQSHGARLPDELRGRCHESTFPPRKPTRELLAQAVAFLRGLTHLRSPWSGKRPRVEQRAEEFIWGT